MSASERETIINHSKGETNCSLYTCIGKDRRKMDKLCEKYPDECKCVESDKDSATYEYPAKWNVIRRPRVISEEERQKRSEAFRARRDDMMERKAKKACTTEEKTAKGSSKKATAKAESAVPEKSKKTAAKESTAPAKKSSKSSTETSKKKK